MGCLKGHMEVCDFAGIITNLGQYFEQLNVSFCTPRIVKRSNFKVLNFSMPRAHPCDGKTVSC